MIKRTSFAKCCRKEIRGNYMYYQILVETVDGLGKSKREKKIYEIDKNNKDEIIKDILVPYMSEEEFIIDGYSIKKEKVIRLKIVTTERSVRELADLENSQMPEGLLMYVSPEDILEYDKYTTDVTVKLFTEAKSLCTNSEIKEIKQRDHFDKRKVFIVHGHDVEAKLEVARFIEKLNLEPIILHEQANDGLTIIEKIEKYSDVGFGIVLYTPCDIGYAKEREKEKMDRARQNVVFEHGYLIAKLGRKNVCALVRDNIEVPNDISGIVYVPLDKNDGWKIALAKEMKSAGYKINFNLFM